MFQNHWLNWSILSGFKDKSSLSCCGCGHFLRKNSLTICKRASEWKTEQSRMGWRERQRPLVGRFLPAPKLLHGHRGLLHPKDKALGLCSPSPPLQAAAPGWSHGWPGFQLQQPKFTVPRGLLGMFCGNKFRVLPAGDAAPSWKRDLCRRWEDTEGDAVLNKRFGCATSAYQRKLDRKKPLGCLMNCSNAH